MFAQSGNYPAPRPAVDLDDHIEPFRVGPDDFVFTSPERPFLRAYQFRRRFFRPAAVASRLAPLRSHDLRHSAISLSIASGGNPTVVPMKARHSSIEVTHDGYDDLFPVGDRYGAHSDVPSASREERPRQDRGHQHPPALTVIRRTQSAETRNASPDSRPTPRAATKTFEPRGAVRTGQRDRGGLVLPGGAPDERRPPVMCRCCSGDLEVEFFPATGVGERRRRLGALRSRPGHSEVDAQVRTILPGRQISMYGEGDAVPTEEASHRAQQFDPLRAVDLAGTESQQRRLPGGLGQDCDLLRELSSARRPIVRPPRPNVDSVEESVDLVDVFAIMAFEDEAAG